MTFNAADVQNKTKSKSVKTSYNGSPVLSGHFISEDSYLASGYDKTPILFKN